MNSADRINATFVKDKVDKLAVNHRGMSSRIASYILGREAFVGGGIQRWREAKSLYEGWHDEFMERSFKDATDLVLLTKQDIMRTSYWRAPVKPTGRIDEYTYLYEYGEEDEWKILKFNPQSEQGHFFEYRSKKVSLESISREVEQGEKDLDSYVPKEEDFEFQIKAKKLFGTEKVIEVAPINVGFPQSDIWFEAMLLDPGLIRALLSQQVERARKNVEFLGRYGFKYYLGGFDMACNKGILFSPALFRELIFPAIKEISAICHKQGARHLFASDGNLWQVACDLFVESGVDGYYEIDGRAGMDLQSLRMKFPDLTLIGNISSWTLSQGNEEMVREEVLNCIEIAKRFKGIVVGLSNYILPETPSRNVDVLLETIERNR